MADIELVIKIPEEEYEFCKKQWDTECLDILMIAVKYGTPLPKGHGRLIDGDALKEKMKGTQRYFHIKYDIDEAPPIIEADEKR